MFQLFAGTAKADLSGLRQETENFAAKFVNFQCQRCQSCSWNQPDTQQKYSSRGQPGAARGAQGGCFIPATHLLGSRCGSWCPCRPMRRCCSDGTHHWHPRSPRLCGPGLGTAACKRAAMAGAGDRVRKLGTISVFENVEVLIFLAVFTCLKD